MGLPAKTKINVRHIDKFEWRYRNSKQIKEEQPDVEFFNNNIF